MNSSIQVFFTALLLTLSFHDGFAAGTPFDLQGFIDKEIKAGNTRIVVPPGRYRVTPKDRQHLLLRGLKDVQIIADGVEMICTETTRALTITRCTNVTVRGLVIDYDPLPYTQGRITAVADDKKIHEIELFDGYPPAEMVRNFKYEIFRPDTRTLRCDDRYSSKIEVVDPKHIRVHLPGGRASNEEQAGDLIVIGTEFAPHGSIPHAVESSYNMNLRLENMDLFASNCFGFLEYNCYGTTYFRCRIDRRPPETDPVRRADPRLRSLDADAYHSKHAVKGPSYVECTARFMGDDCINICGDYHMVSSTSGRDVRILAKHDLNIHPGDPVEIVSYDGRRLPDARTVAVQPCGTIREDERDFLSKQHMDANLKAAKGALGKAYTLTLDREIVLPQGSVIGAVNRTGKGFAVKNCTFGYNRSRGILIKASNGEVSGNTIEGSRMSAILVCPEYWWLEAGSSSDVTLTGNTIRRCGGIPICVEAIAGVGGIAPAGAHHNITITHNTISDGELPGILVTSTTGLRITNNSVNLRAGRIPGRMKQAGIKELQPVVEINCTR